MFCTPGANVTLIKPKCKKPNKVNSSQVNTKKNLSYLGKISMSKAKTLLREFCF